MYCRRVTNNKINLFHERRLLRICLIACHAYHECHKCQCSLRVHVPKKCKLLILRETCQHANKRANVPKECQFSNLASQHSKGVPILQLGVPTYQKGLPIVQLFRPKGVPIFRKMFNRIFQSLNFVMTFANFKNIWAIPENLSLEKKN